jgi:Flp pilus assembly protein TadG
MRTPSIAPPAPATGLSVPRRPPSRRHGHRLRTAGRARTRRGQSRESGSTTLELVVLFPVMLLLILGTIQGALFFHGRSVLLAAAQQGVRAARVAGQSDRVGTAQAQARQFLQDSGELKNLSHLTIVATITAGHVRVTLTARTLTPLSGLLPVQTSQSAEGSLEVFTNSPSHP